MCFKVSLLVFLIFKHFLLWFTIIDLHKLIKDHNKLFSFVFQFQFYSLVSTWYARFSLIPIWDWDTWEWDCAQYQVIGKTIDIKIDYDTKSRMRLLMLRLGLTLKCVHDSHFQDWAQYQVMTKTLDIKIELNIKLWPRLLISRLSSIPSHWHTIDIKIMIPSWERGSWFWAWVQYQVVTETLNIKIELNTKSLPRLLTLRLCSIPSPEWDFWWWDWAQYQVVTQTLDIKTEFNTKSSSFDTDCPFPT